MTSVFHRYYIGGSTRLIITQRRRNFVHIIMITSEDKVHIIIQTKTVGKSFVFELGQLFDFMLWFLHLKLPSDILCPTST